MNQLPVIRREGITWQRRDVREAGQALAGMTAVEFRMGRPDQAGRLVLHMTEAAGDVA